jgi:hypothetical protein
LLGSQRATRHSQRRRPPGQAEGRETTGKRGSEMSETIVAEPGALAPGRKQAARGAALLDEKDGRSWVDLVIVETLDIESTANCVLGQVYGGYSRGLAHLGLRYQDAATFAFGRDVDADFGDLRAAWLVEIAARRADSLSATADGGAVA